MASDPPITTSEALTLGLRVAVRARYSAEHSDPQAGLWFFVYTIQLSNEGDERLQLLSRHWVINDGTGHTEEVRGPGVVGQQPELEPGDDFEYTSGCPLPTPFGSMQGSYEISREDGSTFDAEIAEFELRQPQAVH